MSMPSSGAEILREGSSIQTVDYSLVDVHWCNEN
jgi:hypothetical protein